MGLELLHKLGTTLPIKKHSIYVENDETYAQLDIGALSPEQKQVLIDEYEKEYGLHGDTLLFYLQGLIYVPVPRELVEYEKYLDEEQTEPNWQLVIAISIFFIVMLAAVFLLGWFYPQIITR